MKKVVLILKILAALIAVLIFYYLISAKLDRNKVFAFCLDGDVKGAMEVLKASDNKILFPTDWILKGKFEKRFKDTLDESGYMEERQSRINGLLSIYCNYWRVAVLDNSKNYDTILIQNVTKYLIDNYSPAHGVNLIPDSLNVYTKKYVESFGYHTAGFGKTGGFYDLLVWKSETEKKYPVHLGNEEVNTKVIVASDFITLGWEEYATADRAHPGGWAEMDALYCVEKSYDFSSEQFQIGFLAHETRHFADYKLFPKLKSPDLEYRAKLTELSQAKNTLFGIIKGFIDFANFNSENGHSIANYCVIRDLSKTLFTVEFEKDIQKWQKVDAKKINEAAEKLLTENTKLLKDKGSEVEKYIK